MSITAKEYNGGLTREQFLFYEMRTVAALTCQGMDRQQILAAVHDGNLFQFPTDRMITSIANSCMKRLEAMDSPELTEVLAFASAEVAKQVNLYAMMKQHRLVWEFMTAVIGEKYRTQAFDFSKRDVDAFLFCLREQNDTVASWSDATIAKIRQVLVKILAECGYLASVRSEELLPVTAVPELEQVLLQKQETAVLAAFNVFPASMP